MELDFRDYAGFMRAHISADDFEDKLGLSCDKEHVVGIINSNPLILAITGKSSGSGHDLRGVLPDGTIFSAWPLTLHDRENARAGRRISRKRRLGWLPENMKVNAVVTPLEGEAVLIEIPGFISTWKPQPLQTYLFDDGDLYEVDDQPEEQLEESSPLEVRVELTAVVMQYLVVSSRGIQYYFPFLGDFLKAIGNPIPDGSACARKVFFNSYADIAAKRLTFTSRGPDKHKKYFTPSLTGKFSVAHDYLGTSSKYEADKETHIARLFVDEDGWELVLDLSDSRNFAIGEPAHSSEERTPVTKEQCKRSEKVVS